MKHDTIPTATRTCPNLSAEETVHMLIALAGKSGYMVEQNDNHAAFLHQLRLITEAFGKALRETEESVSFQEAAQISLLSRRHRRASTVADLRSYINRMCQSEEFAHRTLRSLSITECRNLLLQKFGHSLHTYRKAQSILHSIFSFGIRQRWCDFNPAKAILRPPVCEQRINILNIRQIKKLLLTCQEDSRLRVMEAPLRLMLWCGIRPAEVRRLCWGDIDPHESVVYIDTRNSKTGGARAVPLRGGALPLLQVMQNERHRISPANWERLWHDLRCHAGFTRWQNDALRHTFASMHLKRFHNLPLLQEEMGHRSPHLLQTRYLNLRNLREGTAKRFFSSDEWR